MDINATLIGQFITFAILVWFTMKYVWPPIMKAMHDREKKIALGLEQAERSKRELEMAEHKALTIIHDAKKEAQTILDAAHKRSVHLVEEAKQSAREEGARLVKQAQDAFSLEVNQTKEALRKQLGILAVEAAEKIIKQKLDVKEQSALIAEFVTEI